MVHASAQHVGTGRLSVLGGVAAGAAGPIGAGEAGVVARWAGLAHSVIVVASGAEADRGSSPVGSAGEAVGC